MKSFKGRRAFNRCQVKDVSYQPSTSSYFSKSFAAELSCPVTEDREEQFNTVYVYPGREEANRGLAKEVGSALCADCVYSGMDEVEVNIRRAAEGNARANVLEAQNALSRAQLNAAYVHAEVEAAAKAGIAIPPTTEM